jgi:hypothetical protein
VAVAGEQRRRAGVDGSGGLVMPGGEEASELERNGVGAAPGSNEDATVGGQAAQVGVADEMRAAADCGKGGEGGQLWVGGLVGESGGAPDAGVELAGPRFAVGVIEDAVDGLEIGVDAGLPVVTEQERTLSAVAEAAYGPEP